MIIGQTKIDIYLGYENLFMWITIVTVAAAFSLIVLKNKINNVIYKYYGKFMNILKMIKQTLRTNIKIIR
ncbi:hypothetical protein NAI74_09915, partial [Francisella tularensis subsp. holarctica]|nr:hypothetical protein [Francisella tularensis subsp. holarctica]